MAEIASDDDYKSRPGQDEVPVVGDNEVENVDTANADSDEQLANDDKEAIDENNIIDSRTRGAGPQGGYREPGDDEGLETAENDGSSSGAQ